MWTEEFDTELYDVLGQYIGRWHMGYSPEWDQVVSLYPLDDKQAILRVYNSRNEMVKEDSLCYTGETIQQTNMLHEPIADCEAEQHPVTLSNIQPEEIRTYKIIVK